jgi:hypothetical protein
MKYHNKKIIVNGITFDSIKESRRYATLFLLERNGRIRNLRLQVKYELQPKYKINNKTIRSINYVADFVYYDTIRGCEVIEDTKGFRTEVYKIKKKMFEYIYKKEIEEI